MLQVEMALAVHLVILLDSQELEVFLENCKVLNMDLNLLYQHLTRQGKSNLNCESLIPHFKPGHVL